MMGEAYQSATTVTYSGANGVALADYTYDSTGYWKIGGRKRSFHGGAEDTV